MHSRGRCVHGTLTGSSKASARMISSLIWTLLSPKVSSELQNQTLIRCLMNGWLHESQASPISLSFNIYALLTLSFAPFTRGLWKLPLFCLFQIFCIFSIFSGLAVVREAAERSGPGAAGSGADRGPEKSNWAQPLGSRFASSCAARPNAG